MGKKTYLVKDDHVPAQAAFPAIDAHNHLWDNRPVDGIVETMDAVGVISYCDVTANAHIEAGAGGYTIGRGEISEFFENCSAKYPGRFYCFTMSSFAHPADEPLFDEAARFVEQCVETLGEHVRAGAKGLKILKEFGLHYRDAKGRLINVDDERLRPIWEAAGELEIPVLIHQSDPCGFFEPMTEDNEHYESLKKCPGWSFADSRFPRKDELLARRDNLVKRHRGTTFILPHFANYAENIACVAQLLDENSNVCIDFSARLDELGRQPYAAREFFVKYQDRIVFGTDMPANLEGSVDMYRTYFRFLETYDESFYAPDYDGTFDRGRWPICGIGLPTEVLEKIYYKNIVRIIPSLRQDLGKYLP